MNVGDYHVHTKLCGHAEGEMAAYVSRAHAVGLAEMGFSDHLPMTRFAAPDLAMRQEQLAGYVERVQALAADSPRMPVLVGAEVDFIPGTEADVAALLAAQPFDYRIGSVHFVDGFPFDHEGYVSQYAEIDVEALFVRYFELVGEAAGSGLFDAIGHFDLVRKFDVLPPDRERADTAAEAALAEVARAGLWLDVNTAGWRHPTGAAYPASRWLRMACELGVPITFGSDAHRPDDVGFQFAEAAELVRAAGYTRWLRVSDRQEVPLP